MHQMTLLRDVPHHAALYNRLCPAAFSNIICQGSAFKRGHHRMPIPNEIHQDHKLSIVSIRIPDSNA